jgi:hypothetical protein
MKKNQPISPFDSTFPERNRKFPSIGVSFRNLDLDPNLETVIETMAVGLIIVLLK